jgi:hypothetical protein
MIKPMKNVIVCIVLSIFTVQAKATNQVYDLLIFNNDTIKIQSPLLNGASEEFKKLWCDKIYPFPKLISSCNRGAICTWKVSHDSIFLVKIVSCYDNEEISLSKLENGVKKVFAIWLTDTIDFYS